MKGRLWKRSTAGFFSVAACNHITKVTNAYGRKKFLPDEFCTLPKLRLGEIYLR